MNIKTQTRYGMASNHALNFHEKTESLLSILGGVQNLVKLRMIRENKFDILKSVLNQQIKESI
jgi:hypothetical protein